MNKVKGTIDAYPETYARELAIEETLRKTARKHGFYEVDTPCLETLKTLTAKSGEEVKEQIFTLQKKGSEELGLRFDLTIPITRMFVERQKELVKPAKWFCIDKMWRYEAPQKGRLREFTQLSVELFGSEYPEADASVINLLLDCFAAFGLKNDIVMRINNRKLLEGLLLSVVKKEELENVIRLIDKSEKISDQEFVDGLKKSGVDEQGIRVIQKVIKCKGDKSILDKLEEELPLNSAAQRGLKELKETLRFVDNNSVIVDLSIARGLAYYTGNVFEVFDKERKFRALAGGGRYDNLVELFGGEATPATGFGLGTATLGLILDELGKNPKTSAAPQYYVAPVTPDMIPQAIKIAQQLGSADVDIMRRKLAKQFDYASKIGAKKIVIVGERDVKDGKVTIRNLETGKEEQVAIDTLGNHTG